jgi:zinc transporter ZupT
VTHAIDVAAETPEADIGFYGLMALVGLYVGLIPVAIGMLWLPWIRRIDPRWVQFVLALTIGLLAFLGLDALLEGTEIAATGPQALGGASLVFLGAGIAYLGLAGVDGWLRGRAAREREGGAGPWRLAFLVALGIGLHNLGEGLAIGSAYAIGSLALGAALIVGFALHNTTEGLAIVAPVARGEGAPRGSLARFAGLGVLAGAPAILGTWIGASAFNPSLAALLFGLGAGAIAQVIVQIAPSVRDASGRLLNPLAASGMVAGVLLMYATGLLISI